MLRNRSTMTTTFKSHDDSFTSNLFFHFKKSIDTFVAKNSALIAYSVILFDATSTGI